MFFEVHDSAAVFVLSPWVQGSSFAICGGTKNCCSKWFGSASDVLCEVTVLTLSPWVQVSSLAGSDSKWFASTIDSVGLGCTA